MRHFLRSSTARLAATYLALIMVLSVGFSIALFNTSSRDLGRQLPPDSFYNNQVFGAQPNDFDGFFRTRISQGRHDIIVHLVLLNIIALILGTLISYYLARKALDPIETAMEAQARFSSDASHELRTPLTAIRTRNEVALRKPGLKLAEAKEVINSNLAEVQKLESLSEGMLRLSRSDGTELEKTPVRLDEVSNEVMNQFITPAQAHKIAIEDNVPDLQVLGDKAGLIQAISILIDNAIKYGNPNSTVYIEAEQKNGSAFISVRNSGLGIRASDLPHIFERFYRADNSRSRQGDNGYGLGLSIAKQIVDQHDGEIYATSKLDEGAVFTIKLRTFTPAPEPDN